MTQAPQAAPAGWYPSPDGAPVHRWWDGAMWTDATRQLPPPPQAPLPQAPPPEAPPRVELGPAMSGWPAPPTPNLGPLALVTQVFVALAGLAVPVAWAARAWRRMDPPAWLTEAVAVALTGTASGLLVVAGVFWMVWQFRLARSFPPGTPRRSPGWHAGSWLVPVALWWLPYGNVADLFRLATGRRPAWLPVWWVLWVVAGVVSSVGAAIEVTDPTVGGWVAVAGSLALTAAAPFAWLVVSRLTRAIGRRREHPQA